MESIKSTQLSDRSNSVPGVLFRFIGDFSLESDNDECTGIAKPEFKETQPIENLDDQVLQDLISRIMVQDQSALTTLFKAMATRVNSLALRITGSVQLAEEATEDTFFQVWRQAPRFDRSRGTARAWIMTIARSRALDARRNIPRYDELTEPEATLNKDDYHRDSPPDILSTVEQHELLHSALETLDHIPRQLVALAFFRGLSHEEIATHAGLPLGTVKSHIRRAVIHLREALSNSANPS